MRKDYGKLVRDRIPDIIAGDNRNYEAITVEVDEYRALLRAKVTEEAAEIQGATSDELLVEIGDMFEVLDAIIETYGLDRAAIGQIQTARREERGGFSKQLKLLWAE